MIGAIIHELRAENDGRLKFFNRRLMHAAFFNILNEFSLTLGSFVHNEMNIKPFTVSFLEPADKIPHVSERWQVRRDDKFLWRVTALNENILQAALSLHGGKIIQAGNLNLRLEKIICDENIRADSGVAAIDDFLLSVKNFPPSRKSVCISYRPYRPASLTLTRRILVPS